MKQWLLAVLASVVAGAILLGVPSIGSMLSSSDSYLDVTVLEEAIGSLSILHISAKNSGKYAFDPLQFHPSFTGRIFRIALRTPQAEINPLPSADPAWSGTLAAGEELQIFVISDGSLQNPDLQKLFSGTYAFLGKGGVIEKRDVRVRGATEARMALYSTAAKWGGGLLVMTLVCGAALWFQKKGKRREGTTLAPKRKEG